jgi:DNA-binding phage protein
MSADEALRRVSEAADKRASADLLRAEANREMREWARAAHAEGVSMTRIAQEARLSRQGLYDLLADPQSV